MNLFIKRIASFLMFVSISSAMFSQEKSVLPYPKNIKFGADKFLLKNAAIELSDKASKEDKFAFRQLQQIIKEKTGIEIQILQSSAKSKLKAIRILEVGNLPSLPALNETPGSQSREAYHISVKANEITFKANSSAGIYYGIQTLSQLIHIEGVNSYIKEMKLDDYPSIAYRALMMDFAHGGLLTVDEIKRQIDFLARFKTNQYWFYNEVSIELDGFESLNYKASYTKQQIREIIEYARQRHMDVIPNTNLYGHLHELLRNEKYKSLGIGNYGHELDPRNPMVKELLKDWIKQYAELFPSPFVHVGCDETWETKRVSDFKGLKLNSEQLYIDQLNFINDEFKKYGKTTMAWTDMTAFYPDIISKYPVDVIPVVWQYFGDENYMLTFLNPVKKYRKSFMVQPGVTGWGQIYPNAAANYSNMDIWLKLGLENKAMGYCSSLWTDVAEPLPRPSWMFASYGSVISWQGSSIEGRKFTNSFADIIFPDYADPMKQVLQMFDTAQFHLEASISNHNPGSISEKWINPFTSFYLENTKKHEQDLSKARLLIENIQDILIPILKTHPKDSIYINSLLVSARMIHYAASRFIYAKAIVDRWNEAILVKKNNDFLIYDLAYLSHSLLRDPMDENSELKEEYEKQWLSENTPYRLNSILTYFDLEALFWRKLYLKILDYDMLNRQDNSGIPSKSFEELFHPEY